MKRCKQCKEPFEPQYNSMQPTCGIPCAILWAKTPEAKHFKAKAIKIETNARKKEAKDKNKPYWEKKLQIEVNYWVRNVRDKGAACISCKTQNPHIQYCAGHFKTRGGHPELRFEPDNIHRQCNKYCNLSLSGNVGPYRVNLIEKIGQDRVDWLEGPHEPKNYTIPDLKDMIKHYRKLNKEAGI